MQLTDFEGVWRLERQLDDQLGGKLGRFSGTATFKPDGRALRYRETGLLTYGDAPPFQAMREYIWSEDGEGIVVIHGDGRPFHRFDRQGPTPEAVHHCTPDLYRVRYDFGRWPDWQAEWQVSGPRKDYRMVSRYSRG